MEASLEAGQLIDPPRASNRLLPLVPAARDRPAAGPRVSALLRDAIFRRLLIASDLMAAAGAVGLVAFTQQNVSFDPRAIALLPAVVLTAKLLGLYDRDHLVFHKSTLDEAPALLHLSALLTLTAWLIEPVLGLGQFTQGAALTLWLGFVAFTVAGRTAARAASRRLSPAERCLIVGPSSARTGFAMKLMRSHRGTEVVGHLPLEDERRAHMPMRRHERRRRDLSVADLHRVVEELGVHRVVIIPGDAGNEAMLEAISRAKAVGIKVSILPRMLEVVGSAVEFDDVEGTAMLGVRPHGLSRSSLLIKRAMDVALAGLALLVLAPLLAVIAVAIKLDSPGSVLFRQVRVGRDGRRFEMLKFRSMVEGADAQREALLAFNESRGLFKMQYDPRTTRVGRLLRRASLDELPQLLNVLRGDMSLVGPRPLVIDEDRLVEGRHRDRLDLTPGMTGPWQLLGPTRVPLDDMVTLDYLYGATWSLWMDVKILLRTVGHVVRRDGV